MKEDESLIPGAEGGALGMLSSPEALQHAAKKMASSAVHYKELRMEYACALKEIRTKFDVLDAEFSIRNSRNPIASVSTRMKSTQSIVKKLSRRGLPLTFGSMEKNIFDIAGIRVVCSYIDDIYELADAFLRQDDIKLIARKDYIEHPKPNGYRSLHLIVRVPVFFAQQRKEVPVEVQIRTIAMDFWASLEHQIRYKRNIPEQREVVARLRDCADIIARTDGEMLSLRKTIEAAEGIPSEEEELLDKLKRLDVSLG